MDTNQQQNQDQPVPPQGYIDPNTGVVVQGQPQAPPQQPVQPISTGTPEVASTPAATEDAPQVPEYGGEKLRQLEQQAQQAESGAEQKEVSRPAPQQQPPISQPKVKPVPKPPTAKPPQFFGYKVPAQIASNFNLIRQMKGKGDPSQAKSWLYLFLDRLLKKQSESTQNE